MGTYLPRPEIERKLLLSLQSSLSVVLLGPRGSGKTSLLERLRDSIGDGRPTALVQIEPIAASPEILCERLLEIAGPVLQSEGHRAAPFRRLLDALSKGRPGSLLLLDDATEIRTLSYFPGVERPLESFFETLAGDRAPQAVLTSRFPAWVATCFRELPELTRSRFDVVRLPPVSQEELEPLDVGTTGTLVAATGGLPVHLAPLVDRVRQGDDPSAALAEEIATNGRLDAECRATLGQLLHRARGYGACKAVLYVLAAEEGLRLTEVARRLDRTPGSTRDYLRWLEEVDLIAVRNKRFYFVDPVLRLWLRLYGRGERPSPAAVEAEVARHLDRAVPAPAVEVATRLEPEEQIFPPLPTSDELIEID